MDEATLLSHRDLWVEEPSQHAAEQLEGLTPAELQLYQGLREQRWGVRVRLEQERLDWPTVVQALQNRFDLLINADEIAVAFGYQRSFPNGKIFMSPSQRE